MIKNKKIAFVLFVVLFLALWTALDWLYSALITKSSFHWTAAADLFTPLAVAIAVGYFAFLRKGKK